MRGLRKSFDRSPVLAGLDLEVPAGSLTAVLGPSGCGKTTLLRLLAGFEDPDGGEIYLGDRLLSGPGTHLAPEQRRIGFLPQEGALFPNLDVAANIGFGLRRSRRAARVEELLELMDLGGLAQRLPHQLSGGQQQRVALARALAPEPGLILLDEPFDALDAGLRSQVRAEVRVALAEAGATALLVTHDQEEALSLADLVAVMRDGRIVQAADPQAVYRDPVDLGVATAVGDAVLLECELVDGHAETVLGRVPARGAEGLAGAVTLMLRPEQIRCDEPHRDAVRGRVRSTEFYGHDAVARVMLGESGPEVLARTTGHLAPQPGQEVGLAIDGTAVAYPAPDRGPRHEGSAAGRSDRSRIPGDVGQVELVPRA